MNSESETAPASTDSPFGKSFERLFGRLGYLPPKDKRGLNQRRMKLSDEVRTRGGRKSRRRTARVWKPA